MCRSRVDEPSPVLNVGTQWRVEPTVRRLGMARSLVMSYRARRDAGLRGRRDLARTVACLCASWRPPARGRDGDGGQRRSVSCQLLLHPPASDLAMRAALDIDGGHAPHEG